MVDVIDTSIHRLHSSAQQNSEMIIGGSCDTCFSSYFSLEYVQMIGVAYIELSVFGSPHNGDCRVDE